MNNTHLHTVQCGASLCKFENVIISTIEHYHQGSKTIPVPPNRPSCDDQLWGSLAIPGASRTGGWS